MTACTGDELEVRAHESTLKLALLTLIVILTDVAIAYAAATGSIGSQENFIVAVIAASAMTLLAVGMLYSAVKYKLALQRLKSMIVKASLSEIVFKHELDYSVGHFVTLTCWRGRRTRRASLNVHSEFFTTVSGRGRKARIPEEVLRDYAIAVDEYGNGYVKLPAVRLDDGYLILLIPSDTEYEGSKETLTLRCGGCVTEAEVVVDRDGLEATLKQGTASDLNEEVELQLIARYEYRDRQYAIGKMLIRVTCGCLERTRVSLNPPTKPLAIMTHEDLATPSELVKALQLRNAEEPPYMYGGGINYAARLTALKLADETQILVMPKLSAKKA